MAYLQAGAGVPTSGKGARMSPKMQLFVHEYCIDFVGNHAVLRAGYKTKNPGLISAELLQHPLVSKAIAEHLASRKQKAEVSAEYVIQKLIKIVEDTDTTNPTAALRGLELLGKHLGLYRDRQEISGPNGEAIKTEQKIQQDVNDFTNEINKLVSKQQDPAKIRIVK